MPDHTPTPYFPDNLQDYAPWVAIHGLLAPYGECQCGCGQLARVVSYARTDRGMRKGDPQRFVLGHIPNLTRCRTLEEALALHTDVRAEQECWLWTGSQQNGYGSLKFGSRVTSFRAHRVAFELAYGISTEGLFVCHSCDTPLCVNPNHLFLGTPKDNMTDKVSKGRHSHGENHGGSKLSESDVREIWRQFKSGIRQAQISRNFGVTPTTVNDIIRGRRWLHLKDQQQQADAPPPLRLGDTGGTDG